MVSVFRVSEFFSECFRSSRREFCANEGPAGSISSQNRGAEGIVGAALVELTVWLKVTRYAGLASSAARVSGDVGELEVSC
jgi:hypothetical protein